ncbi:MAG: DUF917 family protein [Clostridiaceae bacterium]|nr:DUF917 family protein [Clostridiaceae bacterium]
MIIDYEKGKCAVYGGQLLGGGGGGILEDGLKTVESVSKLGGFKLVDAGEFEDDGLLVIAALVGAPGAKEKYIEDGYSKRAFELLTKVLDVKISGILGNENGGSASANGWLLAAMTGLPVINALCNCRAHPTAIMGSMGLPRLSNYRSVQAGIGGKGSRYIEMLVTGTLTNASSAIRNESILAGGTVSVVKNPVSVGYVKENGSVGAVEYAIKVGEIIVNNLGNPVTMLGKLSDSFGLKVIARGKVEKYSIKMVGGFDVGEIIVQGEKNKRYTLTFWNEYMTLDSEERIATFPDIIATINAETGLPLPSAMINEGDDVFLAKIPMELLNLGMGIYDRTSLVQIEQQVRKDIIPYLKLSRPLY